MLTIRRIFAIVGPLGCGVVFLSGLVTAAEQPPQRTLQATMRTFFQALATVFPLSLETHQFQDPSSWKRRFDSPLHLLSLPRPMMPSMPLS